MPNRTPRPILLLLALLSVLALVAGACGDDSDSGSDEASSSSTTAADGADAAPEDEAPTTVRLGYFPNVTHATAVYGDAAGVFAEKLGDTKLSTQQFNAGPSAVEALFAGALDATYIGPNPAINAFVKSKGEATRIIAGATSGGASLVVQPGITSPDQLKGKKIATPQLGNTQDVALRYWLDEQGIKTTKEGGGDASVVPQENAQTLETFKTGDISAAWVPEPWATRLINEGGGKVLVDEATLWPGGEFVTTHLVVRTKFLEEHPGAVRRLLEGQIKANAFVNANAAEAQKIVNKGIEKITTKPLSEPTITGAWKNLRFTNDPIASSLAGSAEHAEKVGLLEKVDLKGIYALDLLNEALKKAGEDTVKDS